MIKRILFPLLGFSMVASVFAATNLVSNPSFENGITGWTPTSSKIATATSPCATGNAAYVVRNSSLYQSFAVKSNTNYKFTATLRPSTTSAIIMGVRNFNGTAVTLASEKLSTCVTKEILFTTGTTSTAEVYFEHTNGDYAWLYIDNVVVEEVSSPSCNVTVSCQPNQFSKAGGAQNICITANTGWSASENVSWITLSNASGSANGTIGVSVSANTGVARSATVTISATTCGIANQNITITQEAATIATDEFLKLNGSTAMQGNLNMNSKNIINGGSISGTTATFSGDVVVGGSFKIKDWTFSTPDYVFENNYSLRTLDEVENYISTNKHLPEVPSAKEMKDNGVDLSELNMALLKKIEELTLYIIEQKKQIENQNSRIENLEQSK